jgi:hypothetical protein
MGTLSDSNSLIRNSFYPGEAARSQKENQIGKMEAVCPGLKIHLLALQPEKIFPSIC